MAGQSKGEINLISGNHIIPVYVSLTSLYPTLHTTGMIVTDLREKKKQERALEEKNTFIETIIESSHELIAVYDKETTLIAINKACEQFLGMRREQVIGKKLTEIFPGASGSKSESDLLRALGGEFVKNEPYPSALNGRYLQNYITPLRNEQGEIYAALAIANDLTEIVNAEQEIKAINKQLEEKNLALEKSNAELASFNYVASHDLQEPLRKIQTFSTRIIEKEQERLSDSGKMMFERMQMSAKRMQTLIDDLLSYSFTNSADRKFERVNLHTMVDEVRQDLSEELKEKNATVEITEMGEANILPFQFKQLLYNLISNSLKFSRPDQPPRIKITSETASGKVLQNPKLTADKVYCHLSLTDNGIGFEPQYSEKIFELFQRLKSQKPGTGIGLSIVKRIVENHNGIVTARGELGKGAVIDIYLPAD